VIDGVSAEIEEEDHAGDEELLLLHVHDLKGHETDALDHGLLDDGRIVGCRPDEDDFAAEMVVARQREDAPVRQEALDVLVEGIPAAVVFRKRRAERQRQVQLRLGLLQAEFASAQELQQQFRVLCSNPTSTTTTSTTSTTTT